MPKDANFNTGAAPDYPGIQKVNVALGYESRDIVYMCDNGYQKIYRPVELVLKTKCETALSINPNLDRTFLKGISKTYFPNRYQDTTVWNGDVFISSDEKNCPITNCLRYLKGCNTPINAITKISFWPVTIGKNTNQFVLNIAGGYKSGYTDEICIVCTNGK